VEEGLKPVRKNVNLKEFHSPAALRDFGRVANPEIVYHPSEHNSIVNSRTNRIFIGGYY
jgi:hypothetical protein